ncbi:hypothetical protein N7541_005036 [Penicillium brevicompactum]|uniref:PWI domain-containing protein n=1 Tax=Penicillium brevicompactum TaxID=5074 RepID=A0A9W9UUE6_PENBR|nr:hypothetical protein N7541_005036 [Penicillium brevicompactum]
MASSVDAKLLKRTKFPPEFNRKVDMTKVNIEVMKKWIASRISEILGNEDDVVIELCFGHLEGARYPDIKSLQIQLTGFLDKDTAKFCQELWSLCLSGQENPQGVPKELLEAKKLELIQEKLEAEKAAEAARRQKEQDTARERDIDHLRRRERSDRGRGAGGSGRGRGGRDFGRRSPPPRDQGRNPDRFQLLTTLALHLALDPPNHPHPAAIVMSLATGPVSAVVALQADQYLPTDATAEEREGPARTTVTVLDLDPSFPAVSRAHDPPEENAAVSPHRPIMMCTVDAPRTQNHPLAHVPARVPDAHLTGLAATAIPVV